MNAISSVLFGRRAALLLALLFLPLLLSGCASLWPWGKKSEAPTISLADIEVQGINGLETIFLLKLRVMNPNDKPLQVRGLNCALHVSDKPFANGISDEHVDVPASGTATATVKVYAAMFDLAGSVIALLQHGVQSSSAGRPSEPLRYKLTGQLRLGDTGEDVLPFALTGSLPPEQ